MFGEDLRAENVFGAGVFADDDVAEGLSDKCGNMSGADGQHAVIDGAGAENEPFVAGGICYVEQADYLRISEHVRSMRMAVDGEGRGGGCVAMQCGTPPSGSVPGRGCGVNPHLRQAFPTMRSLALTERTAPFQPVEKEAGSG